MSITKVGDRKYKVIIHLGYDGGTRKTKSKRFDLSHLTEKQAEKEIIVLEREFEGEVKGNPDRDKSINFRSYVEMWLSEYAAVNLRPKTIASYRHEINRRILPEFGYMKLSEIRPMHLVKFYNKVSKQTYEKGGEVRQISPRIVRYQHQILSSMFSAAVIWQIVDENPCKKVSPPKNQKQITRLQFWEVDSAISFLDYIKTANYKYLCAIKLALFGGLRTEDILGLDLNDVTEEGVIIRRTSKIVQGLGMVIEELTKTGDDERFVSLHEDVIADLKKLKAQQMSLYFKLQNMWGDEKINGKHRVLLFTQNNGKPMHGNTIYNWFKRRIKKYNSEHDDQLLDISVHDLRHTNATLMIYLNADISVGAGRLGHAQKSTYLNIYGHMLKKADRDIADKLGDLLHKKA